MSKLHALTSTTMHAPPAAAQLSIQPQSTNKPTSVKGPQAMPCTSTVPAADAPGPPSQQSLQPASEAGPSCPGGSATQPLNTHMAHPGHPAHPVIRQPGQHPAQRAAQAAQPSLAQPLNTHMAQPGSPAQPVSRHVSGPGQPLRSHPSQPLPTQASRQLSMHPSQPLSTQLSQQPSQALSTYSSQELSQQLSDQPSAERQHLPSLQQHCLAVVGVYLQDYVEVLSCQLALLPPDNKSTLMAIARRRGTLCDETLVALADEGCRCLDLSHSSSRMVTLKGCVEAARHMRNVQALDISGSTHLSTPQALSALATSLPRVKLLRCGGGSRCNQLLQSSLLPLLPALLEPAVADADSWEDAFNLDDDVHPSLATSNGPTHARGQQRAVPRTMPRFQNLQCVVWPTAPPLLIRQALQQCPRLKFNPGPAHAPSNPSLTLAPNPTLSTLVTQVTRGVGGSVGMPEPPRTSTLEGGGGCGGWSLLDPMMPCDQAWVAGLPPSTWAGANTGPDGHVMTPFEREKAARPAARQHCPGGVVHPDHDPVGSEEPEDLSHWVPISVRFRQAYIDQAVRVKGQAARAVQQAEVRQLRSSPALAAVARWLDDY